MIKKLVTIAALAMLLGSPASYAAFITGNELADDCRQDAAVIETGFCYGYVIGTYDTYDGEKICVPSSVPSGQLVAVVKKFLKETPELLHLSAYGLVALALSLAFPC